VKAALQKQLAELTHRSGHPAAATDKSARSADFSFKKASYILTMRSAGIEYWDQIPRDLQQDQGFSYVDLLHDIGQPQGRCESIGAAYWLGQEVEEGVLGKGAAPPDAGDVSGGYQNSTVSRDVEPNLSAGDNQSNREPGVKNYFPPGNEVIPIKPDGPGYHWTAKCADDTHGKSQGDTFNVNDIRTVGSTTEAGLDKSTGIYTSTSRAYIEGLEGVNGFDSASTLMQITNAPNEDAKISYRMSYFNSGDNTGKNGVTFGGSDIPAQQFADTFNDQAKTFGDSVNAAGPAGAATLKPEVGTSTDGDRFSITISVGHGNIGFAARKGTLGQNQGMRLASITFQGLYGDKN
jgi:hypothetical protein